MSPRIFLRLLQPVRTIPFVACYTAIALLFGHVFGKLEWPRESLFVAGAVTLPLLFGVALTASVHAVLHRPFALLLPEALPRLRQAAALSYGGLAVAVTLACYRIESRAPLTAVFGLALGLLTLTCAHRRQGFPRFGILGALPGTLVVSTVWLVFQLRYAHELLPALQSAPWAFFLGGCGLCAVNFALGFTTPGTLRARATTPYFAWNTTSVALCDQAVFRRQLQEKRQIDGGRGINVRRAGRDWPRSRVGPHLRDWLRVLDHQRVYAPVRLPAIQLGVLVAVIASEVGVFGTLGIANLPRPFHLADFFAALANLTAPAASGFNDLTAILIIAAFIPTNLAMLMGKNNSRPALAYPLGRARLAGIVFAHTCRDLLVGLLIPCLAFWTSSLLGQAATGHLHPGLGLPAMAVIGLVILPFPPLSALECFLGGTRRGKLAQRVGFFILMSSACGLLAVARQHWSHAILTPAGIFVSLLATTASVSLLRHRIENHYRTCDLTDEVSLAQPFGAQVAASR